jgi:hypothetical protein
MQQCKRLLKPLGALYSPASTAASPTANAKVLLRVSAGTPAALLRDGLGRRRRREASASSGRYRSGGEKGSARKSLTPLAKQRDGMDVESRFARTSSWAEVPMAPPAPLRRRQASLGALRWPRSSSACSGAKVFSSAGLSCTKGGGLSSGPSPAKSSSASTCTGGSHSPQSSACLSPLSTAARQDSSIPPGDQVAIAMNYEHVDYFSRSETRCGRRRPQPLAIQLPERCEKRRWS